MKYFLLLIVFVSLAYSSFAVEKVIPSKITGVTVFLQGAQINRSASANLKKGRSEIVFSKLSNSIDINSIQLGGKGQFTILSVYHRINYIEIIENDKNIARMIDSVKILDKKMYYLGKMKIVYTEEMNMLLANKQIGGSQVGVDIEALKKMSDFYRSRLTDIQNKYADIEYEIAGYNERKGILQNQINSLNQNRATSVSEVVVEVEAEEETSASFDLSYIAYNAGWTPTYDLRAIDVNNPLELTYRANVFQNTGEDWDNVKLTISTGNPRQNGTIPTFYTWYLQYRHKEDRKRSLAYQNAETATAYESYDFAPAAVAEEKVNTKSLGNLSLAKNASNFTTVNQNQTSTLFEISIPYTIPSSGKEIQVKVQKYKLNAQYRYYCAPKLDVGVFLEAMVTGWEDLSLTSGNMNVFFEGTYVGKSFLDANNLVDTLSVSLGRDESINVSREKVKDKSSKSLIGGTKKEITSWEISVRNTKQQDIKLVIEDQVPISNNKEIEVEISELSNGKLDATTGLINWEFKLSPKQSQKIKFSYILKYPKEFEITNKE